MKSLTMDLLLNLNTIVPGLLMRLPVLKCLISFLHFVPFNPSIKSNIFALRNRRCKAYGENESCFSYRKSNFRNLNEYFVYFN